MGRGIRRQAPALVVACVALVAALGGTVYADKKAKKISGKAIKLKSLPGNRLALGSVPGNRLKPGSIAGDRLRPGTIPGDRLAPGTIPADRLAPGTLAAIQIDPATLGQVPSAVHAENADSARDAQTALHAVDAINATKVNGRTAGCQPPDRYFAGACWEYGNSEVAVNATTAAEACATRGGELPEALALAAYSHQPGIVLDSGGEWSSDIPVVSGPGIYAVATVSAAGEIGSALSTATRKYRCVLPLVR